MVVSVIEITTIALLVMVGRTVPLMARMIRHDAIVRKGRERWWQGDRESLPRKPCHPAAVTSIPLEAVLLGVIGVKWDRGDLVPECVRHRGREEADRLGDALRPAHADDRRRHAWVASRELQRDGRQGDTMPIGDGGKA